LLELRIGGALVMHEGLPAPFDAAAVTACLSGPEVELLADLHMGPGAMVMWTCTWGGD
ncbi:MAG: arginine biosynthesis protein ArgJ, partial [Chloroflexales bacterium]|nr:arginine biosynthesis protein ArgJ [Chloroflexales bacterium]